MSLYPLCYLSQIVSSKIKKNPVLISRFDLSPISLLNDFSTDDLPQDETIELQWVQKIIYKDYLNLVSSCCNSSANIGQYKKIENRSTVSLFSWNSGDKKIDWIPTERLIRRDQTRLISWKKKKETNNIRSYMQILVLSAKSQTVGINVSRLSKK